MMKKVLFRVAGILIALAALPACQYYDEHTLLVINNTADDLIVDIEADTAHGHEDDVYFVAAGRALKKDYDPVHDMDVFIVRQSDNVVLFAGGFDHDDFEDDHDTVEIIVGP